MKATKNKIEDLLNWLKTENPHKAYLLNNLWEKGLFTEEKITKAVFDTMIDED